MMWKHKDDFFKENGLVFIIKNLGSIFNIAHVPRVGVRTVFYDELVFKKNNTKSSVFEHPVFNDVDNSAELFLFINGFSMPSYVNIERPRVHHIGDETLGYSRTVYEFIFAELGFPIRAGLTVHKTFGTWSSYPAHKFELDMLTRSGATNFEEKFALLTNPPGGWGLCSMVGYFSYGIDAKVEYFNDRDILEIPLGSHPIVAGPGFQLAYFWVFQSKSTAFIEKFAHGERA